MEKHILVTGGAGFVGRNLVKQLVNKFPYHTVWVLDDLSTGIHPSKWPEFRVTAGEKTGVIEPFFYEKTGAKINFIECDVMPVFLGELGSTPQLLPFVLPSFNYIYHLASIVGGRAKIEGDPLTVGLDLAIDASFYLWAAKVNKPSRILYASSSAAYPVNLQGQDEGIALKENMIDFGQGFAAPDFTYGWSKLTGEYLGKIAFEKYGMNIAVIRPFSGYGEWQEPVYPVPAIAMRAAAMFDPLYVWGTGEQCRDFVHIDDCIQCMILAIENISDGTGVNIGSGIPTSFLELAALFADIVGYQPAISGRSGKPVGVAKRYCDPNFTKELLGFYPSISLREGMTRVVKVANKRVESGVSIPV